MSIMHHSSTVANAAKAQTGFTPTTYGRVQANGHVAIGDDYHFNLGSPGPNASCDVALWVIQTSTNCYVRVGINDDPNQTNDWYNTTGTPQGDPGNTSTTGATVYELGQQCDTVTIDHTDSTTSGSPTFTNPPSGGTYTDNVGFSPTTDTKYGREIQVLDVSSLGPLATEGTISFSLTFAKTGFDDATVSFSIRAKALSEWEP